MYHSILITIDVEDWFQVENFKKNIPFETWNCCELRVEKNIQRLLDLFDTISESTGSVVKATFFILGWIAERLPKLVKEIQERGHEVASHGYNHNLCYIQTKEDLKNDLLASKKLLEDITGNSVAGYRAPNFSVSDDILKLIEDCGYHYDSSYNSFGLHRRYGALDLSGKIKMGSLIRISDTFFEIPVSNLTFNEKMNFPWGGGGYFRLIPFLMFKLGVKKILKKDFVYVFYIHPWEIDPEQPRVKEASALFKFRHYTNLKKTYSKLSTLIESSHQCRFVTCSQYLAQID